MGALPATKTPIGDLPHLVGIPAPEHLRYQAVIVASIVPRVHALEAIPVVGKDLFEEVPGRRSCCSHQAASLQRVGWWVRALFYHIPSMTSTPSAVLTRVLPPPRSPLHHGDVRAIAKWKILLCCRYCQAPFTHFFLRSLLPFKAYPIGNTFIAQMFTRAHMRIHCGLPGAAKVREDPYHHPGLNTRCFRSHGLV